MYDGAVYEILFNFQAMLVRTIIAPSGLLCGMNVYFIEIDILISIQKGEKYVGNFFHVYVWFNIFYAMNHSYMSLS